MRPTQPRREASVCDDWLAPLPEEKHKLFDSTVAAFEASYSMLSVALDEAFALRRKGTLVRAREQAAVSADLLDRLAARILAALAALEEQARHSRTLPRVVPLNPGFFRGKTAQRTAGWNSLLHRVLLSNRSRFFSKLRALREVVGELVREFREVADEIADGASVHPEVRWQALDCLHYDLNTCLRETVVVLKSFLRALPAEEFEAFHRKLEAPATPWPRRARSPFSRAST